MAHFAELDNDNIVQRVIVVSNDCLLDENGQESEQLGRDFCERMLGGRWVQTSYNRNFRKHYAGPGFRYDSELDAFIPPQPFPSWTLDSDCVWQAPTPMPVDGPKTFYWDEQTLTWMELF